MKANKILIIDTSNWKKKSQAPHISIEVNNMSINGKICRKRAILEFERRMMGNVTEEIFADGEKGNVLSILPRQQIAMYLDPRVKRNLAAMDSDGWQKAKQHFEDEYVKFYCHIKSQERKEKEAEEQKQKESQGEKDDVESIEVDNERDTEKKPGTLNVNNLMSDSDSSEPEEGNNNVLLTEEEFCNMNKIEGKAEFYSVFKKWKKYQPNYMKLYPKVFKTNDGLDLVDDLLPLDMLPIMDDIKKRTKDFGYILLMMRCSASQLGALNAESLQKE